VKFVSQRRGEGQGGKIKERANVPLVRKHNKRATGENAESGKCHNTQGMGGGMNEMFPLAQKFLKKKGGKVSKKR